MAFTTFIEDEFNGTAGDTVTGRPADVGVWDDVATNASGNSIVLDGAGNAVNFDPSSWATGPAMPDTAVRYAIEAGIRNFGLSPSSPDPMVGLNIPGAGGYVAPDGGGGVMVQLFAGGVDVSAPFTIPAGDFTVRVEINVVTGVATLSVDGVTQLTQPYDPEGASGFEYAPYVFFAPDETQVGLSRVLIQYDLDGPDPDPDPEPGTHIRDDFNGTAGATLVGRVPNITDTGEAWQDVDTGDVGVPDTGELRLDGAGNAVSTRVGGFGDGHPTWGGTLLTPSSNALRVEFELYGDEGDLVTDSLTGVVRVRINGADGLIEVIVRPSSLDFAISRFTAPTIYAQPDLSSTIGEGGAHVVVRITADASGVHVVCGSDTISVLYADDEDPTPVTFNGATTTNIALVDTNALAYIDIEDVSSSGGSFWTLLAGTYQTGGV